MIPLDDPRSWSGRTLFAAGPGKDAGKTTFLVRAAALARRAAAEAGLKPPGLLSVGYDGEARDYLSGACKPTVPVEAGDVYVTAERFLRQGGASPEILEASPGRSALGRLCVARATRAGRAALVGPEGNGIVAELLSIILDGGLASVALVDGSVNRITQIASRRDALMAYALRIDRGNQDSSLDALRRVALLLGLPLAGGLRGAGMAGGDGANLAGTPDMANAPPAFELDGALTASSAATLPKEARAVIVGDFTKVFLDYRALLAFMRTRSLLVRSRPEFAGFVAVTRGLSDEAVLGRLSGDDEPTLGGKPLAEWIRFNPYATSRDDSGDRAEGAA